MPTPTPTRLALHFIVGAHVSIDVEAHNWRRVALENNKLQPIVCISMKREYGRCNSA